MPDDASVGSLRIVHACAPADVGGLERVVQGLACGQARRGHDVTVVAIVSESSRAVPLFAPMADAGVRTVALEFSGRAYLRERAAMRALLRERQPQVLHTHGYRTDLLHGGLARRLGVATATTLHGSSRMGGLSHLVEWWQGSALRRFDAVVAVSRPLVDELHGRGVHPERVHFVPNAWVPAAEPLERVAARKELGARDDGVPVVGWAGRLIPIKGADVFIRALAAVRDREWRASIIGEGPERGALEALAAELGLAERVRFHGAIHGAARVFAAFDLFVLSSRSEGTPMVLLEAIAAGLPVVASSVGGIPDIVQDGRDAWLVPPEQPTSLARAITSALASPDEAARRATAARARVTAEFDAERWIDAHERLYADAVRVRAGAQ